jgi:hypothetical protein
VILKTFKQVGDEKQWLAELNSRRSQLVQKHGSRTY